MCLGMGPDWTSDHGVWDRQAARDVGPSLFDDGWDDGYGGEPPLYPNDREYMDGHEGGVLAAIAELADEPHEEEVGVEPWWLDV